MTRQMHIAALLLASGASQQCSVDAAFAPASSQCGPLSPGPVAPSASSVTNLGMSKNADRARWERNLEELMDNDWRAFRARLVLQETRGEEEERGERGAALSEATEGGERLANLFSGIISSVFQNGNKQANGNDFDASLDADGHRHSSIFEGIAVGGATASSVLPGDVSDPFASPAELPAFLPSDRVVKLDKHRWAHPLPHVETGSVLVANEGLGGVFHQTVVLVIDHHDATGSEGIVINR